MTDIRTQLPECPLAYEVPLIPGTHTALVIPVTAADIEWQAKMLPWTLASLINNTDLVMQGVRIHISCEAGTKDRIRTVLKRFDLPERTIVEMDFDSTPPLAYDTVCTFNINYWAFRDAKNQIKLSMGRAIHPPLKVEAPPSEPFDRRSPCLCDMAHATVEGYRYAIKHLMGAQLAMRV